MLFAYFGGVGVVVGLSAANLAAFGLAAATLLLSAACRFGGRAAGAGWAERAGAALSRVAAGLTLLAVVVLLLSTGWVVVAFAVAGR
jgi:hypothetical protein